MKLFIEYLHKEIKIHTLHNKRKVLLIWDTFPVHCMYEFLDELKKLKIDVVYIPGGTTGLL